MKPPSHPSRRAAVRWAGALGTAALLPVALPARAQGKYPDQPIKLIVALPAGGSVDMVARALAQRLATAWGQPWVVDNRAGGSGQIGMPAVARAAPDGYTLTISPASFLTTNKSVFRKLPYDPEADRQRHRGGDQHARGTAAADRAGHPPACRAGEGGRDRAAVARPGRPRCQAMRGLAGPRCRRSTRARASLVTGLGR